MSRPHDEHGRVVDVDREHGPEWWAMDREYTEEEFERLEREYERQQERMASDPS